jgi:hypothetical protein
MSNYRPDPPVPEGNDCPEPVRVWLYRDGYASVNGEVLLSAFGPNPVKTIARKLIAQGLDPDAQELLVHHDETI